MLLLVASARCSRSGPIQSTGDVVTLRVGVGVPPFTSALNGVGQVVQNLSTEALARIGEDGRPTPLLADGWKLVDDGRSLLIQLRAGTEFHDGSPVNASAVSEALNQVLPQYMGPALTDIRHIRPIGDLQVEIAFRQPSPFLLEALDAPLQKPGAAGVGTGPFIPMGPSAPNEMRANANYYLGRPTIDRIVVSTYPNARSAWAELLRDRVDMLYEVGVDALDSLAGARNVTVFTFVRRYQYLLIFNVKTPALQSREIRRALNQAIDKEALVRDAFDGHAVPSFGPVWPQHWAAASDLPRFSYDPQSAAEKLSRSRQPVRFTCLVKPDLERLAMVIKRQLEDVGIEMSVEEAPLDEIYQRASARKFDAVLVDFISGASLFRPYQVWRSGGLVNPGGFGSEQIDRAFDLVRHAKNDAEYRSGVRKLQQTVVDDPPAVFLAWSQRARAVSNRFQVPVEGGRDILTTLRLWRPAEERVATRN